MATVALVGLPHRFSLSKFGTTLTYGSALQRGCHSDTLKRRLDIFVDVPNDRTEKGHTYQRL